MERLASALDILLIILGAIGFYEARSFGAVRKLLSRLGFLKRFIFRSRTVTIVENKSTGERDTLTATATGLFAFTPAPRPPGTVLGTDADGNEIVVVEEHNEDLADGFYFTVAALTTVLWITVGHSVLFWLALPFRQIIRAATVWSDFSWSLSGLIVPMSSLGHLLLGVVTLGLVYTLGLGAILKSALIISDTIATRATRGGFRFVLCVLFVGASVGKLLVGSP